MGKKNFKIEKEIKLRNLKKININKVYGIPTKAESKAW